MRPLFHLILYFLGVTKAQTQTSNVEQEALVRYASGKKRLVEIGVWHGVNTAKLRKVMSKKGTLIAIDPFPSGRFGFSYQRLITQCEVSKIHNGKVIYIRKKAEIAGREYAKENNPLLIDFIFIDAEHTFEGLKSNWEAWSRNIALDGIVAIHDSCSSVTRNIDNTGSEIFTRNFILKDQRFKLIEVIDTLTILKKIKDE